MIRVLLVIAALTLALPTVSPAQPLPDALAKVRATALADEEAQARLARCPADVFATIGSGGSWSPGLCTSDPMACWDSCGLGDAGACLALAYDLQTAEKAAEVTRDGSEMLFSEACAAGHPAGCTNRAASVMQEHLRAGEQSDCTLRSFALSCAEDDAWGCTMLGRLHATGLGTEKDPQAAQAAFDAACAESNEAEDAATAAAPCRMARDMARTLLGTPAQSDN